VGYATADDRPDFTPTFTRHRCRPAPAGRRGLASFEDDLGRTWTIIVTAPWVRWVRLATGIDLAGIDRERELSRLLARTNDDPEAILLDALRQSQPQTTALEFATLADNHRSTRSLVAAFAAALDDFAR
jgi:hypothetical protein